MALALLQPRDRHAPRQSPARRARLCLGIAYSQRPTLNGPGGPRSTHCEPYLDTTSDFAEIIFAILGVAAKLERRRILERTARGRADAARSRYEPGRIDGANESRPSRPAPGGVEADLAAVMRCHVLGKGGIVRRWRRAQAGSEGHWGYAVKKVPVYLVSERPSYAVKANEIFV